jgi:hypothetical protein
MEIIARAAVLGVRLSVNERNGRLHVEGRGDASKPLLNRVREMRDQLVLALTQGAQARLDLARERHRPLLDDVRQRRPPDVRDADWEAAIDGLWVFLAAGHGDEAQRLGWSHDELFRIPQLWSQIHLTGAALLIGDREVVDVTAVAIRIETASSATLAFYRKQQVDYGVAYRARLKQIGDDGFKEEAQLRALEAVVNFYRANHPGADIDTANAAVRAAIKEAAP